VKKFSDDVEYLVEQSFNTADSMIISTDSGYLPSTHTCNILKVIRRICELHRSYLNAFSSFWLYFYL